MSFNKIKYDQCAYTQSLKESTTPLEYNLFKGKYENCQSCTQTNLPNIIQFGAKVDIENELFGLNKPFTKCVNDKNFQTNTNIVINPLLCEHNITPSNMPFPKSNGLNYSKYASDQCFRNK